MLKHTSLKGLQFPSVCAVCDDNCVHLGAVIVLGDFNAHLGRLGGARGCGETNAQGVLVGDLMARCHLNAISLGSVATGPCHTYESGSKRTTVDYIFADEEATSMLLRCRILPMDHPWN